MFFISIFKKLKTSNFWLSIWPTWNLTVVQSKALTITLKQLLGISILYIYYLDPEISYLVSIWNSMKIKSERIWTRNHWLIDESCKDVQFGATKSVEMKSSIFHSWPSKKIIFIIVKIDVQYFNFLLRGNDLTISLGKHYFKCHQ